MLEILVSFLLKFAVSLHPYSGKGKPPMFGDYEAQRHWMEITYNLPLKEWYFNTTHNDLMYWGLDYPPLTAYHSLICGFIAAVINPQFVELHYSRGFESENHKLFMRYSVFCMDLLIFVTAFYLYFKTQEKRLFMLYKKDSSPNNVQNYRNIKRNLMFVLIYPGLILIDYGHFQYNCVSLGLFVLSVTAILRNNLIISSFFFCSALSFKQMELYHSFPFFFYILGICWNDASVTGLKAGMLKLSKVGLAVVLSFIMLWFPFITDLKQLSQVLHRIFPVARGVFEDKVSNIWCVINIFYKLRLFFDNESMAKMCIVITLISLLPSSIDLLLKPSVMKFHYALINSSLSFFLFSFQVHEKSILLAAIPVLMVQSFDPLPCFWFLLISTFSLFPLMVKDDLAIPFVSLTVIYMLTIYLSNNIDNITQNFVNNPNQKFVKYQNMPKHCNISLFSHYCLYHPSFRALIKYLMYISIVCSFMLTFCSVYIEPPTKYPDLFPLLISVYSCVHFLSFWIYFNCMQLRLPYE